MLYIHGQWAAYSGFSYSVQPNVDSHKNLLLLKNLQFLFNHYETASKRGTHDLLIFCSFKIIR